VAYGIDYERDSSYESESSRFHALWRRSNPTRNSMHRLLDVSGRGQYIGNFLQLDTNYEGWWGEGDTIFQIDGNTFTHSPGTEDEYGSAWGFDHRYSYTYNGYIEMGDGHNRMYRWYVTNPVRFQRTLVADIQDQRFENGQKPSSDDITSVAYFYLDRTFAVPLAPYHERIAPSQRGSYPRTK
jgi:hypothetical protein